MHIFSIQQFIAAITPQLFANAFVELFGESLVRTKQYICHMFQLIKDIEMKQCTTTLLITNLC